MIEGQGPVAFDHSSFIVDEEKHLRLVFYAEAANQGVDRQLEPTATSSTPLRVEAVS
jgi:hypothetical protein